MYENIKEKNAMLLDVQYIKPNKHLEQPDVLYTIYKDLDTGEKKLNIKYEPRMDIYFEKPEYRNHSYSKIFAPIEEVDIKQVKYTEITKAIVNEAGPEYKKMYSHLVSSGNYRDLERFQLAPFAFGTDFDVRTYYRLKWFQEKDNDLQKHLSKGYMDIEVDSIDVEGFAQSEVCPINAISLIDADGKCVYLFALVGRDMPESSKQALDSGRGSDMEKLSKIRQLYNDGLIQQEEAYSDINNLKATAHEMFDENYPGFDYKFFFFKHEEGAKQGEIVGEAKLIINFFKLVHNLKLDFIEVWNMGFDIPYIMDRLKVLGFNPADIMCHPDFPIKQCYYKKDLYHFSIKNKTDFFLCSSYTIFIDQMITYAAIRKGAQEFRSYKLNTIGQSLLGDKKLDFSEEGDIKTIPYTNYVKFIMYNIKDTLLQYGIENKTEDLENVYLLSYDNITPFENIFKQTVFLRNLQYKYYLDMGLIPGNNINQILNRGEKDAEQIEEEQERDDDYEWDESDSDDAARSSVSTYEGALNADPTLNKANGEVILGKPTNNINHLAIDMDMKAFYPNSNSSMNITPNALIFKAYVSSNQFMKGKAVVKSIFDNAYLKPDTDVAKDLFDNFLTGDYLYCMNKWFNLPSIEEVCHIIEGE